MTTVGAPFASDNRLDAGQRTGATAASPAFRWNCHMASEP